MATPTNHTARPPALADFILLNEELAALVRARVPIESHLARLGRQLPRKSAILAERIGKRLEAGEDLVAAIEAECKSLPGTYRAALVAGIESGNVGAAFQAIVESTKRLDQLRHVTLAAVLYPLVLVILVCWLLALVITRVVPAFDWIKNTPVRPLLGLSQSPYTVPILTLVIPGIIVGYAIVWWWRTGRLGGASPRLGLVARLAGSGRIHRWGEAARFAELMHLLVARGLPLENALRLASEATGDRRLRDSALQLASRIEAGQSSPLGAALQKSSDANHLPVFIRLALEHADDRPLLIAGLRQAAEMYRNRTIRAAEWYAEYLPILFTIGIGGTFTIGFTLLILWPYASMLHELSSAVWR